MPDALAFVPTDRPQQAPALPNYDRSDMAAFLRQMLAEQRRRRGLPEDAASAAGGGSADLLALATSPPDSSPGGGAVDLAGPLGGLPSIGTPQRAAVGGPRLAGPARPGEAAPGVVPVGATTGAGGGGTGSESGSPAPTGIPASIPSGIPSLSVSHGIPGLPGIGIGLGLGGNLGLGFAPTSNPAVNTAFNSAVQALGIPTSVNLATALGLPGVASALGMVAGPLGIFGAATNLGISLAEAAAKGLGITTVKTGLNDMALSDVESGISGLGRSFNDPVIAEVSTAVGNLGLGIPTSISPQAARVMAAMGLGHTVSVGPNGLGFVSGNYGLPDVNLTMALANLANLPGLKTDVVDDENSDTSDPGITGEGPTGNNPDSDAGPAGVSGAVGMSPGPAGPDSGPGDAGPGDGDTYIVNWALHGLGVPDGTRKRFDRRFMTGFRKRFPHSGESQFRRYHRLARQVVGALDRQPPAIQDRARRLIYGRIVAPLGDGDAPLMPQDVDQAWGRMRDTALGLANQLGLKVDPADVPQPAHEIRARQFAEARDRRARARTEAEQAEREEMDGKADEAEPSAESAA